MPAWTTSFGVRLAAITLLGLVVRVVFALHFGPRLGIGGDGLTYHFTANFLADGKGYVDAQSLAFAGVQRPSAEHPPLYPTLLGAVSALGGDGFSAHRVASCFMGAGTVAAIGFLGRRVGGARVGLLAGAIAALHPLLVLTDETLYSESLYGLTIALALIAAYRYLDRTTGLRAAVLGGAIGLAAMTRSEALLLLVLLAVPVVWQARVHRLRHVVLVAVACVVVIAPWTIRSTLALDSPVLLSTNLGGLLAGANCHATYYTADIGTWKFTCFRPLPRFDRQAELAAYLRRKGLRYARHHAGRVPVVVAARVGRVWDVYRPLQNVDYEAFYEGRQRTTSQIGLGVYYVLLALAVYGAVVLRRRRETLLVLLAPFALVTVMAALSYGITRFRIPADVALVVLAAVACDALMRRLRAPGSLKRRIGRSTA
jgi:hypothetical protein